MARCAHLCPYFVPSLTLVPLRPALSCALATHADGCWFYLAQGSGVYINVTRTKVAETRVALRDEWHLPHDGSIDNDGLLCERAVSHGYGSVQILRRVQAVHSAVHEHAAAAAEHTQWGSSSGSGSGGEAYDASSSSPHHPAWRGAWSIPELVLCLGPCVSQESTSPCPGLPLWRDSLGATPCECDQAYPLLRCREETAAGQDSAGDREDPCPARTHPAHTGARAEERRQA